MIYDPELGAGGIMKKKAGMGALHIKHNQCEAQKKRKEISSKIKNGGLCYNIKNNAITENSGGGGSGRAWSL